jgi:hypothetical protein
MAGDCDIRGGHHVDHARARNIFARVLKRKQRQRLHLLRAHSQVFPQPDRETPRQWRGPRLFRRTPIVNGIRQQPIYWTITYPSGFSFLLHMECQLDHLSVVRKGKTMRFKASCVTGSPARSIGARAINGLGLIATMMIYSYSPPLRAMEETLVVTIDQARVVNVPTGTEALIVGNAAIADLTLLKQGATMIITGKGFGETNFIALDAKGNPLAQSLIRVVGGRNALLVQRGLGRQSYACAPQCLPTVKLGDDAKYFVEVAGQVKDHNAQATGLQ